uniref:RING-CH-type domain-containing protein n=1 Tax=Hanusia phi TaxID=3032 RepID=A0A7S0F7F8_9CRYP|mmetsp:Transcript_43/g.123  ORF Transcript_43/g.123 Transcript_43/m.123 type:complete len:276 (+) Transcript_43:304-1131(+)
MTQRCCRICFEAEGEEKEAGQENPLISPCACRGSQEFIHRSCLQQCQLADLARGQDKVCRVCKQEYSLQLEGQFGLDLKVGKFLVASHSATGSLARSVILLCEYGARVMGVIVTHSSRNPDAVADNRIRTYLGGPVCGGRFGVVRYFVLWYGSENGSSSDYKVLLEGSEQDVDGFPKHLRQPVEFSVACDHETVRWTMNILEMNKNNQAFIFKGYCAWTLQQLRNEIFRGMWGVAEAKMDDLLRFEPGNLWNVLNQENRVWWPPQVHMSRHSSEF